MAIGKGIGRLAFYLARRRRHIAAVNISLCFPNLTKEEQNRLVKENMLSLGMGLIETATAWLRPAKTYEHRFHTEGLHHLQSAIEGKQGVLLIGFHFTTMDLAASHLSTLIPLGAMYRKNKNPALDYVMRKGRVKNLSQVIERDDIKQLVRSLKQGNVIWYGPDQDYGRKHSVFVDFFNIKTATLQATSRIAKLSGSKVIVFTHARQKNNKEYTIHLSSPLEDFPLPDTESNARLINELAEKAIIKIPEQYWWIHRRFKTRPPGEQRPY